MTAQHSKRRKGDGGTYLVIADDSPEFSVALHYAVHMARLRHGHVAIARIIEPAAFIGWGRIDKAVKDEARTRAEADLQAIAAKIKGETGIMPSLTLREGDPRDEIVAIARANTALVALVLATSTTFGKSNPLVSYFTAKGISKMAVPVIIVPGHLDAETVEKLA